MRISFESLPEFLTSLGYRRTPVVSDKGQFSCRGGILDLFPVASTDPYRIEFFGDSIERIRTFDPIGQKTIGRVKSIFLSPAKELPLLQRATRLCSIVEYLDRPILVWDDLLAIEDAYVGLLQMPGARSSFFLTLEELLHRPLQHLFCAAQKIEELSSIERVSERTKYFAPLSFEMCQHRFEATRFFHPFGKIEPLEETLSDAKL